MSTDDLPTTREAVAVFKSEADLQAAIDDLLMHGFDRAEISLLASSETIETKMGRQFQSVEALEDDPEAPRIAYVSTETIGDAEGAVIGGLIYVGALAALIPVVASGGALAAGLLAATIGGGSGAAIGTVLAGLIGQHHADYISDQLEHGGLTLWVRTWNEGDEARAIKILKKHSGGDVHMHGLPDLHPVLEDRYLGEISEAERRTYQETDYVESGEGEFYFAGKLFPGKAETEAYIERMRYLETLHSAAKSQSFDLAAAMFDPTSEFATPANLMASSLPDPIKLELLQRWAYDARELETASGEGMIGQEAGDPLQEIERHIVRLSG